MDATRVGRGPPLGGVVSGARRSGATAGVLVVLAASLGLILAVTLLPRPVAVAPTGDVPTEGIALCLLCGELGAAHFLLNVLLFAPFGIALGLAVVLRLGFRGWLLPTLLPALLSLGIETAQLAIPGRQTALADLAANAAGGWLGLLVVRLRAWWIFPRPGRAVRLGGIWSGAVILGLVATGWLLEPSFPDSSWYGQWTARLGHLEAYRGTVLDARIGGAHAPSRRLDDSRVVRSRLAAGAPVRVRFVAGPPPPGTAPIFSIYDERRREILLLGADGEDLVLRYRMRAADARLARPDLRIRRGLRGVAPGDTLELAAWRTPDRPYCLSLARAGGGAGIGESGAGAGESGAAPGARRAVTARCDLAHTAGRGWALLHEPRFRGLAYRRLADPLWALLLGVPAGWWLRRRAAGVIAAASLPAAAGLVPLLFPLTAGSPAVVVSLAAGVAVGLGLQPLGRASSERGAAPSTRTSTRTRTQRSIRR